MDDSSVAKTNKKVVYKSFRLDKEVADRHYSSDPFANSIGVEDLVGKLNEEGYEVIIFDNGPYHLPSEIIIRANGSSPKRGHDPEAIKRLFDEYNYDRSKFKRIFPYGEDSSAETEIPKPCHLNDKI